MVAHRVGDRDKVPCNGPNCEVPLIFNLMTLCSPPYRDHCSFTAVNCTVDCNSMALRLKIPLDAIQSTALVVHFSATIHIRMKYEGIHAIRHSSFLPPERPTIGTPNHWVQAIMWLQRCFSGGCHQPWGWKVKPCQIDLWRLSTDSILAVASLVTPIPH